MFSNTRTVNQATVDLVKQFEDYETALPNGNCRAYLDTAANRKSWSPGYNGLWTIGWGSTGPGITEGTVWTRAQAEAALHAELDAKAREVQAYIHTPLNDNQFGAVVSLAYNVGTGGIHDLLNLINAGDLEGAANAFLWYDHSDGVRLAGLTRRRYAEKELFEWETPQEVTKLSPLKNFTVNAQRMVGGTTLTSVMLWNTLGQAKQIATDNAGWILLGIGAIGFAVFKYMEVSQQKQFDQGTLIPPGTKPVPTVPPEIANAPNAPRNITITAAPSTPVAATTGVTTNG